MKYTTNIIRNMFLKFFEINNHTVVQSSTLIPPNNSNLLFTNAGMNQFQDIFLGKKKYPFSQITTIQRCLRTGGKHNDLEQVGYSQYHNTFFEMLGNFSFGSYFKKEAILYAWKLLTHQEWFNISKEKLFVTIYYNDHESYDIWKNIIKLSENNIIKIGNKKNKKYESDNFWQMNETGPCGPCTEIFFKKKQLNTYDLNDKTQCLEIWNIVFIQFNKIDQNTIIPLKTVSVDTGMGLERISSVLQNVDSIYHIDSFQEIKNNIKNIYNIDINQNNQSINIICDHIRSVTFLIGDNILPSNEHRGYILRKIIRRALLHGNQLGIKNIFFYKLVTIIIKSMQNFWKHLDNKIEYIENILKKEELQFINTLYKGLKILKSEIKKIKNNYIDSKTIFYLYDTIGFPIDLTKQICDKKNIKINEKELKNIILQHKINQQNKKNKKLKNIIHTNQKSKFIGYKNYKIITTVQKIFIDNQEHERITPDQLGIIILQETPFFGESGGQIGDTGILYNQNAKFQVSNTQNFLNAIGHIGKLISGTMHINDTIKAEINVKKRFLIQNNHSATHLLNAALKQELKYNIEQKGSFINDKYLRFDFSYPKNINIKNILHIEKIINAKIQKNILIQENYCTLQTAQQKGYVFLKNKYYHSNIRTLSMNNFSKEICKGTHANRTGDIGIFKIMTYKNIASGIKRIEAMTGKYALQKIHEKIQIIEEIKNILKTNNNSIIDHIKKLMHNYINIKQDTQKLHQIIISYKIHELMHKIYKIKNINFLVSNIYTKNSKLLKIIIDEIKRKIISGIIILFYQKNKNYFFISSVTTDITDIIQANTIIDIIKSQIQGSGGGKKTLAECIGNYTNNIYEVINYVKSHIISQIS